MCQKLFSDFFFFFTLNSHNDLAWLVLLFPPFRDKGTGKSLLRIGHGQKTRSHDCCVHRMTLEPGA